VSAPCASRYSKYAGAQSMMLAFSVFDSCFTIYLCMETADQTVASKQHSKNTSSSTVDSWPEPRVCCESSGCTVYLLCMALLADVTLACNVRDELRCARLSSRLLAK